MTLGVFFAVLFAAFLHAAWNALIKLGVSKMTSMLILTIVQGCLGIGVALGRDFPAPEVWPWLLGSGAFHAGYKIFLAKAYEHGDLSRVYPIARGTAPLLVLGVGALILSDIITGTEVFGILLLGGGILMMARGVFSSGESRHMLPFALASAVATAGYSLVDGLGARVAGDSVTFVAWLFAFDLAFFLPVALLMRGTSMIREADAKAWGYGAIAALLSYSAYAIAVWAMTQAPIALVTALRETSILFAVLIGWIAFGERMDRPKAFAAFLIVAGVVFTRL